MELFSLTKPQKSIWNMEQFCGGSVANITGSLLFEAPVDVQALRGALNKTLEQCDSLRLRIQLQDGTPTQYIHSFAPCEFEVLDFADQSAFDMWITALARTPFELEHRLYKLFIFTIGAQTGVVLHLHHLTADAWTLNLLANTIMQNLKGEVTQRESYTEYLAEEQAYENSRRRAKDKEYFISCFEKCSEPVYLSDKQAATAEANRLSITIDKMASQSIQAFCDSNDISPYALFMNALATYLYRVKGAQAMFVGTTVLNRAGHQAKNTPGLFINTVPVLMHIDESASVLENLHQNTEALSGVFRHQKYQYNDLLHDIREQYGAIDRLFDVMLNYQNATLDDGGMTARWHFCGCQGESLNIHINDRQREGLFHIDYDYQTELFSAQEIERLHGHMMNLITDIIKHPEKKPQEVKLLSDAEYRRVVLEFNDTAVAYPSDKCIHQLFEEQAEKTPDAIAVVFEGREYAYRQINDMANSLAQALRERGIGRNDIVAIIAKRSYKIIVAQFAVLKAGGAYLPIDPSYPVDRIKYMLSDAKCKLALILEAQVDGMDVIVLENEDVFTGVVDAVGNINATDDLCYVIYTSGSTGLPKGTMLTHRSVGNYCHNNNNNVVHRIISEDMRSIVSVTTIGFDIFVTESLLPLVNGMTVIFANEQQANMQSALNDLVLKTKADVLQTTPSKMQMLMLDDSKTEYLSVIKAFILGGEALETAVVDRLRMFTDARIFNIYGPTETTVWSSNSSITSADITIGKPIANTQIYILDKHLQPLPVGVAGELCISGDGVGRGYLNRPELTAEKFIPNPFLPERLMYRTGDLAKWRDDGNIEYIGRMDHQVKIRGLRIELGEIEAAIAVCPGVKQIAAVVKTDEAGRQYICAYYVGEAVDAKAVRVQLVKRLPQYMVPHFFIPMERFPATPSGKTDRKAFPTPDFTQSHSDTDFIAPETEREKALVGVVEAVLGMSPVGMNDDFFDLGGDSLKAIEFVAKAHNAGICFALQNVFDYPTPAALLSYLDDGDKSAVNYTAADFEKFNDLLQQNQIDKALLPVETDMGNLFLTGATGFLGAHILDAYLRSGTGTAYCLVRGSGDGDAQQRLDDVLKHYFGGAYADSDRVIAVCGDITSTMAVNADIRTVIHSAATVKHYGSYKYFYDMNVVGTKNVIDFTKSKGANLVYISTISVSGDGFVDDFSGHRFKDRRIFSEQHLFIDQPFDNVYARSKFEAEVEVLNAMLEGLRANIVRVGNLTNRHSDAGFQINYEENAFVKRVKAVLEFGLFPDYLLTYRAEFSPIDYTADAVIKIARHFSDRYSVFHVNSHKPLFFDKMLGLLKTLNIDMKLVDASIFTKALLEAARQAGTEYIYEALMNDMDSDNRLAYDSNISIENTFTVWYLNRLGFEWPNIDIEYLAQYIDYFRSIGYLEV